MAVKFVTNDNLIEFKRKCDILYSKKGEESAPNAVLYVAQSLQDAQKQQARTNIGAQVAGNYITDSQFSIKADRTYVDSELLKKQNVGDYATNSALTDGLAGKQDVGDYATNDSVTSQLKLKQNITDNTLTTTAKDVPGAINELNTALSNIRTDIINEAHFRGYFATNAELQESPANANDYAYSAESGTVWTHNGTAWEDTSEPVPDKTTPLGTKLPVQDGTASAGVSTNAAREDHVHPTDTSRAAQVDFLLHKNDTTSNPHGITPEMIKAYKKPPSGIPKSDLESTIQTALTMAAALPVVSTADNDKILGVVAGTYGLISPMTNDEIDAIFA